MIPTSYEEKINDGWILYYSEEGYPYYYREATGESEWAPVTDENGNTISYEEGWQYSVDEVAGEADSEEGDSASDTASSGEDDDDSEEEDSTSTQSATGSLDKALEEKFKEYLQTPEGIAAAEAEFARLGRKLDKRIAKKSSEAEKEYVRGLGSRKKDNSGPAYDSSTIMGNVQAITTRVVESTNAWMFPVQNIAGDKSKKQGGATGRISQSAATASASSKYEGSDRATKHRRTTTGPDGTSDARVAAAESGRADGASGRSPNSSRSSSISSDTGSFSSDDSDVAQLDAPLFSEVPPWLSLQNISNTLAGAFTALNSSSSGTGTVTATDSVGGTASTNADGTPTSLTGFNVLFEHLNPVLENFVESLIDTSAHPIVRAARSGPAETTYHREASTATTPGGADVEQPREVRSSPRSARANRSSARSHPQPGSGRANVLSSRTGTAARPDLPPTTPARGGALGGMASPRVPPSAGAVFYTPGLSPPSVPFVPAAGGPGRRSASSTPRSPVASLPPAVSRQAEGRQNASPVPVTTAGAKELPTDEPAADTYSSLPASEEVAVLIASEFEAEAASINALDQMSTIITTSEGSTLQEITVTIAESQSAASVQLRESVESEEPTAAAQQEYNETEAVAVGTELELTKSVGDTIAVLRVATEGEHIAVELQSEDSSVAPVPIVEEQINLEAGTDMRNEQS